MQRTIASLFLLICLLPLQGCTYILASLWTPAELDTSVNYIRSAEEDVELLTQIYAGQKTDLWGKDAASVVCIETDAMRIFQCEHHYVLIYPPNWNARRYNVMLIAGQVPELPARGSQLLTRRFDLGIPYKPSDALLNARAGIEGGQLGTDSDAYHDWLQQQPDVVKPDLYGGGDPLRYGSFDRRVRPDERHHANSQWIHVSYTDVYGKLYKIDSNRADAPSINHGAVWRHIFTKRLEQTIDIPVNACE